MRLFLAIPVPDGVRELLTQLQQRIPDEIGGFNYVQTDQAHLTLKFMGDAEPGHVRDQLDGIDFEPFTLRTTNIGYFPNDDYIRVIWLGLTKDTELKRLADETDARLPAIERDHDFHPHITITRVKWLDDKERLQSLMQVQQHIQFTVDTVHLIQSDLAEDGPVYTTLTTYGSA